MKYGYTIEVLEVEKDKLETAQLSRNPNTFKSVIKELKQAIKILKEVEDKK